jgi:putative ABC transport system permease protein
MSQVSALFRVKFVLRTAGNPALLANALRGAVAAVDSQQPVFDIQTMDQRIGDMVAQRRLTMLLIGCFAMLAVVLAAVGVYGVFAFSVTQRAHELGIRLALGASRGGLLRMVLMEAARLVLLGGVLGLGAAWSLNRLLADLLVGVAPHDALSLGLAWGLMTAVALLAGTLPAAGAARTDLVSVLHAD